MGGYAIVEWRHENALPSRNTRFYLKELAMLFMVLLIALMFASLFIDGGGKSRGKRTTKNLPQSDAPTHPGLPHYSQDHQGHYPGVNWMKELAPHVEKTDHLFVCPSDST